MFGFQKNDSIHPNRFWLSQPTWLMKWMLQALPHQRGCLYHAGWIDSYSFAGKILPKTNLCCRLFINRKILNQTNIYCIYTAYWCILMHIAIQICVLAFVVQCRHVFTGPVLHRAQFWCKSEASTYFPTIGAYWHTLDARRNTKTMADKVATMLQYEAQMPIRCRRCNHADDICTIVVSFAQKYNERKCWYGRYFRRKDLDNHLDHS